jgi:hypothetical protein
MELKYYVVTIRTVPGDTGMIYPVNYQEEIGRFAVDALYYPGITYYVQNLLVVLPADIVGVVRTGVKEISEAAAKAISEANEKREIQITDGGRIEKIQTNLDIVNVKRTLGLPLSTTESAGGLTVDDLKALDETDSSVKGFEQSLILSDRIDILKTK